MLVFFQLREEPWLEDIDDKNYKKLILHLNLHTANESNFQNLLKNMDNEIQNVCVFYNYFKVI